MQYKRDTWTRVRRMAGALTACALVAAGDVMAQATPRPPERITYQGFVAGSDGVALGNTVTKNYDVIFRIFDSDAANALPLWGEQQTVTVDKGYFSVLLGEGAAVTGAPNAGVTLSSLFTGASASDRWVGMTVKGIGTGGADVEILPRVRLMTSPYAFLANRALAANTATKIIQDNTAGADLLSGSGSTLTLNGKLNVQGANPIEFGAGVAGKETSAGQITYGGQSNGDSLDIVGAGTTTSNRKIRFYSEGGAFFNGPLSAASMNLSGGLTVPTLSVTSSGYNGIVGTHMSIREYGGIMFGWGLPKNYDFNGWIGAAKPEGVDELFIHGLGLNPSDRRIWLQCEGGLTVVGKTRFVDQLRIMNKSQIDLMWGQGRVDAEAGKIAALNWTDGMDIVGAGPAGGARKVYFHTAGVFMNANHLTVNGIVYANNFAINSDRRIKDIDGVVGGSESMEAIRKVRVTDYRLKQGAGGDGRTSRGVIAQELKSVLPNAIQEMPDLVPDINESGVAFAWDGAEKPMEVTTTKPHGLAAGDKVRLEIGGFQRDLVVESIRNDKTFAVSGVTQKPEAVRVVGREVKDFMRVDYQQVYMTAVSALQEVDRRVQALEKREARMEELEKKAARVESMDRDLAELKKLVAALTAAGAKEKQSAAVGESGSGGVTVVVAK